MVIYLIIKIYKTNNCKNCEILLKNLKRALDDIKRDDISIIEEKSLINMSKKNIVDIPALEIEGSLISEGVVYSVDELIKIINNEEKSLINKKTKCHDGSCSINDKK